MSPCSFSARTEISRRLCPRLPLLALDLLRMSAVGRVHLVFCGFELRWFSIGGEFGVGGRDGSLERLLPGEQSVRPRVEG